MLCLCLRDMLKARFIGEMIETDREMGRTLQPLQHVISVALTHLSLLLYQPLWSAGPLCMITTLNIEINRPRSWGQWTYNVCAGAMTIAKAGSLDSFVWEMTAYLKNWCLVKRKSDQCRLWSSKASVGGGSLGGNVPFSWEPPWRQHSLRVKQPHPLAAL